MIESLDEMKNYLRIDGAEEDALVESLMQSAEHICSDVIRGTSEELAVAGSGKAAVMYATAYLYEHREEADHHQLMITLRSLLFGERRYGF